MNPAPFESKLFLTSIASWGLTLVVLASVFALVVRRFFKLRMWG